MTGFTVILDEYKFADPAELAELLSAHLGLMRIDALQKAAHVRGFVVEQCEPKVAKLIRDALEAAGHQARLHPSDECVGRTRHVRQIHRVRTDGSRIGLSIDYGEDVRWVPLSTVEAVLAGVVHRIERKVPRKPGRGDNEYVFPRQPRPTTVEEHDDLFLDLYMAAASGSSVVFRVKADELNYLDASGDSSSPLSEEAIPETRVGRFCRLLDHVCRHASSGTVSNEAEGLRAYRGDGTNLPDSVRFESDEEFRAYGRWLLQMHRLGWPGQNQ